MSDQPTDQASATSSNIEAGSVVGLTPLAHAYLDQTRPWVRFISIMTFVGAGVMVLVGIVMLAAAVLGGFAAGNQRGLGALGGAVVPGLLALFYVALAFVYVIPGTYLARYARAIKQLRVEATAQTLEDALRYQKSFWRFAGIVTVISVVFTVVAMVVGMFVGVIAAVMAARS